MFSRCGVGKIIRKTSRRRETKCKRGTYEKRERRGDKRSERVKKKKLSAYVRERY